MDRTNLKKIQGQAPRFRLLIRDLRDAAQSVRTASVWDAQSRRDAIRAEAKALRLEELADFIRSALDAK